MERYLTLRNSLLVLTCVVFLVAWNRGITLLYGMLAMLVATLVISYIAPLFMLRGIRINQVAPEKLQEDDEFEIQLDLSNSSKFSRYMIEVWNHFPGAAPDEQDHMALVPRVKKAYSAKMKYVCERRGAHTLGPVTLKSEFPMGINMSSLTVDDSSTSILVYPRAFSIQSFPYVSGDYMPMIGVNAVAMAGGSDVFFGTREYRHGDSPRHIHWPSSARHNELIVKEYEYVTATEVTLLLDLNKASDHGEGKHSTLEYSIKIAASIARHALDNGHHVRLLGYGKECMHVSAASGEQQYQNILEALAHVQANGDMKYQQAMHQALSHVHESGVLVLFNVMPMNNTQFTGFPELEHLHIMPVQIEFDSKSFLHPVQLNKGRVQRADGTMPVYRIRRGDDLEKVFQ